jgi:Gas vesicle synthesis protein GvpL/GvpF
MSAATYTYAVARPFDPIRAAGLVGVDGAAIHLVRHEELVAVVSPLAPAAADETALRARLGALAELEAIARAHHGVVAAVAACTPTLPFRLATVHSSDDRVAEVLRREYRRFCETLDRLVGRVEVGLKIYVDRAGAPAGDMFATEETGASGAARVGRDYLRYRREQRDRREQAWQRATSTAEQMDAVLAGLAFERRQHRTQSAELSAGPGENVYNAAYLVDAGRADELAACARRLSAENPHVRIEITGPWPPYSFAASEHREGT